MAKPDYGYWGVQPEYSLRDAGFLCCDQEPESYIRGNPYPPRVDAMMKRLMREVDKKFSPGVGPTTTISATGNDHGDWAYTGDAPSRFLFPREFLRQWAETTGQREAMPFLFPEDQGTADPAEDSLRADTKDGYLFLIGLLVHALAGKGGPALKTPQGPNQAGIHRLVLEVAGTLKVSTEGLGRSQFNEKVVKALVVVKEHQEK